MRIMTWVALLAVAGCGAPRTGSGDVGSGRDGGVDGGSTTCTDNDRDGYGEGCAEGPDCDDQAATVNPAMPELPDDGIDNDCRGGDLVLGESTGVFVSENGNDSNAGTRQAPLYRVDVAIDRAEVLGVGAIFVSGPLRGIRSGVHTSIAIYGGYDDATWTRLFSATARGPRCPDVISACVSLPCQLSHVDRGGAANEVPLVIGAGVDVTLDGVSARGIENQGNLRLAHVRLVGAQTITQHALYAQEGEVTVYCSILDAGSSNTGTNIAFFTYQLNRRSLILDSMLHGGAADYTYGILNESQLRLLRSRATGQVGIGSESDRDVFIHESTISGMVAVGISGPGDTFVSDATLIASNGDSGTNPPRRAVALAAANGRVVVENTRMSAGGVSWFRYAVHAENTTGVLRNNQIEDGSVYLDASDTLFAHNEVAPIRVAPGSSTWGVELIRGRVERNRIATDVIVMPAMGDHATLAGNDITGGLFVRGDADVINNTIVGSAVSGPSPDDCASIQLAAPSATIVNNIIVLPDCVGTGRGIEYVRDVELTLAGNLFFGAGMSFAMRYWDFFGGTGWVDTNDLAAIESVPWADSGTVFGNVASDPGFVDALTGDHHLAVGSAAIDAATDPSSWLQSPVVDIDGVARPSGAGWDIGAYEVP